MPDWFEQHLGPRKVDEKKEEELWQEVKKTIDKKILNKKIIADKDVIFDLEKMPTANSSKLGWQKHDIEINTSIEYRVKKRLRRGHEEIEATIDLHGMTLNAAEQAVIKFIESAYISSKKYLLVITGKGREDKEQTIRNSLPSFLQNPKIKNYIISYEISARHHGGEGAFYIVLRKPN